MEDELAMYRRIMNDQQLRTHLVTKDLKAKNNFRELAVDFDVTRGNIQKTFQHMA